MTTPEVELRAAWQHTVGAHHELELDHLLGRLREPHRRYHTATHVMWVLRHVAAIAESEGQAGAAPAGEVHLPVVRFAALYHDAVYDPQRGDNEAVSAELAARTATGFGWPDAHVAAVRRLVMATAGHHPVGDDEAMLVDADLAILGAPPNDYAAYVTGVRSEYAHVGQPQWRTGRAQVLQGFLDEPRLFHTAWGARLEQRARANLTAELVSLRA